MEEIINKVELSGIITLDLLSYKPTENDYRAFDMVPFLYHGYLLQEKAFRVAMIENDWSQFRDQAVIVYCSNDAIVPYWAYVYVAALLQPYAAHISFSEDSDQQHHLNKIWKRRIQNIDYKVFKDKKVVLKARSEVSPDLYLVATQRLMLLVQSLMWGEAGSPIMIHKRKKTI